MPSDELVMDFGKHCGRPISMVPTQYLRWANANATCMSERLRAAIATELQQRADREAAGLPPMRNTMRSIDLWDILKEWHRDLIQAHHPDYGGSLVALRVVNDAHRRLVELIREAAGHTAMPPPTDAPAAAPPAARPPATGPADA